jgi:hypothetical protein
MPTLKEDIKAFLDSQKPVGLDKSLNHKPTTAADIPGGINTYATVPAQLDPKTAEELEKTQQLNRSQRQDFSTNNEALWQDYLRRLREGIMPYMNEREDMVGGTASTNANGMGAYRTNRLARLADAMNNTYYIRHGDIGSRFAGSGSANANDRIEANTVYQMPIETEEQRQMARAGQHEIKDRGQRMDLRQTYRSQTAKLEELRKLDQLAQNGKINDEQLAIRKELRDELMYENYRAQLDYRMANEAYKFQTWLTNFTIKQQQIKEVTAIWQNGDQGLATVVANMLGHSGPLPNQLQSLTESLLAKATKDIRETGVVSNGVKQGLSNALQQVSDFTGIPIPEFYKGPGQPQ